MAVTDQQKLDFLLKKIGYTKTKTGSVVGTGAISGTPKQPFAEAIPSPLIIANSALWNESGSIPTTPPGSDTAQVKVYLAASSGLRMTADSTSSGQRAFIAYSTYGNSSSTRLTNWIDTQFGSAYLIKVYKGDPNSGGVALSAAGSGANDGWFFDYSAGVLNFNDTNVPSGVTDTNIYIVGYRYIGLTGAPTPTGGGNFTFNDLVVSRNFSVGGLSTFTGNIDANGIIEGIAGENKIPSLYANLGALPSSTTYHGMFAHVHSTGRGYFAHAGNWLELVNKETNGVVGTGTEAYNIGNLNAVDGVFSGNVSIGGTLTYEDVKNVDAVGLITARSGIRVTGGVIEAQAGENKIPSLYANLGALPSAGTYHGMFAHVHATGRGYFAHAGNWLELVNKEVNGVVGTGTERYNIGPVDLTTLDVSGISTFAGNVDINADIDVDGHTNLDNVSVSGIITANDFNYWDWQDYRSNIRIGNDAGNANLVSNGATGNILLGDRAGTSITSSSDNVMLGASAGRGVTTGTGVYIGASAGRYNQTGGSNVYIGAQSGSGSNHSGNQNVFVGTFTGIDRIGSNNTLVGYYAGRGTGGQTNDGDKLSFFGNQAGQSNISGDQNSGFGYFTLHNNESGDKNSGFGNEALKDTTGNYNSAFGADAGKNLTSGANNLILGYNAQPSIAGVSNEVTIGDTNIKELRIPGIGVSFNSTAGTQLGIITATELDISGDIDVDGHTNLDNVSIAGVTSVASLTSGRVVTVGTAGKLQDSNNLTFDGNNLFVRGINIIGGGATSVLGADITTRNFKATGVSTFVGDVQFDSGIKAGGSTGSNGQYLKTTGSGVEWATFPTLRTRQTFTASSGQTAFSFSYTINFIDVFVNGIKLTDAEFTATNGSTVVLAVGCFVGDIVELVSYNTVSGGGGGGGGGGISNVVEDTTPQLGGNLDLFNKSITGTGNVNITGIITATNFVGDGSGLTNVVGSGSGVVVKNSGSNVGTAGTIDFGNNLSVSPASAGIVTITAAGISTNNGVVSILNDLDVDGHTNLDNVSIAGVVTATTFVGAVTGNVNGNATGLSGNPSINVTDLDVDGHTNLDNVSVAGVTTFSNGVNVSSGDLTVATSIKKTSGTLDINANAISLNNAAASATYATFSNGGAAVLKWNNTDRLETTTSGITVTGTVAATSYTGDGSQLTGIVAGITTISGVVNIVNDLDVDGHTNLDNVNIAGVVTATTVNATTFNGAFIGNGSGLTGVVASGSGIVVKDDGSTVGTAGTVNFTEPITVTPISAGITTVGINTSQFNVQKLNVSGITTTYQLSVGAGGAIFNSNSIYGSSKIILSGGGGGDTYFYSGGTSYSDFIYYTLQGGSSIERFRINSNAAISVAGSYGTAGQVLTSNGSGSATTWTTVSGGGGTDVGITTNLSGTFTASAGTPATINTFAYHDNDKVVEYTVYIKNGSDFQSQKLLAMRDGTTIHSTQFAVMFSSSLLVQCDATISSGNILLRATPETGVSGSTTYKIKREVM